MLLPVSSYIQPNKMYTGKPVDFHHFCGEMSESIEYPFDDANSQVSLYRPDFRSFRMFPKGLPSYGSEGELLEAVSMEEELLTHPQKQEMKYKCFKCFGTNRDISVINGQATACSECDGTEYVSASNGLASILEQVLTLKLPHLTPAAPPQNAHAYKSLTALLNYGSQRSIQEQECSFSYVDETMKECNSCHNENQTYHMFSCTTCPDFFLCFTCYQRKKYTHPPTHQLVNKGIDKISVRYIKDPKTMKKISEEVEAEEASNCMDSSQADVKCHSCNQPIQECYMVCVDCETQGCQYILCAECPKEGTYLHETDHKLDLRTISQTSKLSRLTAKPSASQSEITQPTPSKPSKCKVKVKDSLVHFQGIDLDDCENQEENDMNKYQQISLPEEFMRFRQWEEEPEVHLPTVTEDLFSRMVVDEESKEAAPPQAEIDQGEDFTHLLVKKKGRKIEDSVVNIYMQTSIQIPASQKSQQFSPTLAPFAFSTLNNQIVTQKSIQSNPQEYIFNDYECDICKVTPIKNKRYHCKECQNFDLCQMCFLVRCKRHEHKDYELIDGVEIIKKSRESLMIKAQQNRNKMTMSRLSQSRLAHSRSRLAQLSNRI